MCLNCIVGKRLAEARKASQASRYEQTTRIASQQVVPRVNKTVAGQQEAELLMQPCTMNLSNFTPANVHLVYFALFQNGRILGMHCGHCFPGKSKPVGDNIPQSLHPTMLQLKAVHYLWIDWFPFPSFRDKIIVESATIEEQDFLFDLFTMPSFMIIPGCKSWDPSGWKMIPLFKAKWGYLFE